MLTYIFSIFVCLILGVVLLVTGFLVFISVTERRAKKAMLKAGYYVHWQTEGPESGTLFYEEGDNCIKYDLYFYHGEKFAPVVYVPSNGQWNQKMPEWVKDRKNEVVTRIRKHFQWPCEDTTDLSRCWWREIEMPEQKTN